MAPSRRRLAGSDIRSASEPECAGSLPIAFILALTVAVSVSACGGDESGSWVGTVDTLSGGTVRVRNPATGLWTAQARPGVEIAATIGRATGDERFLFGDVRDIEVDGMGRVWVLDNQSRMIRVFGSTGRHVRTIGGAGQGPGEFRNPNGLARDPTSGRIWVVDPATSRYTVFDTAGTLVETRPRDATGWGYRWPGRFDQDGRLFDFMIAGGPRNRFRGLVLRSGRAEPLDTLRLPAGPRDPAFVRIERENGRTVRPVPFAPRPDWDVSPRGSVWWTSGDPYRLLEVTSAGDTARIVERELDPTPVTEAEMDSIRDDWTEEFGQGVRQVDFSRIPDAKAAIRAVFVGRTNRIWVLPYGDTGETGRLVDVFDPEGRYLGRLELPVRLRWSVPPVVTHDAIYGVREEPATGVDQVVVLTIEW